MDITTTVGSLAALGTTVSYFPQLLKCWKTGEAGDLSFKMFAILAAGVALLARSQLARSTSKLDKRYLEELGFR